MEECHSKKKGSQAQLKATVRPRDQYSGYSYTSADRHIACVSAINLWFLFVLNSDNSELHHLAATPLRVDILAALSLNSISFRHNKLQM